MELTQVVIQAKFDYRDGALYWKSSGRVAGTASGAYVKVHMHRKFYYAHRLIWMMFHGETDAQIDHIDGNKKNNNLSNLRLATRAQNSINKEKYTMGTTSKYKGVNRLRSGRWQAATSIGNITRRLGIFDTEVAAAIVYNNAVSTIHGPYAYLNHIDEADCDDALRYLSKTAV